MAERAHLAPIAVEQDRQRSEKTAHTAFRVFQLLLGEPPKVVGIAAGLARRPRHRAILNGECVDPFALFVADDFDAAFRVGTTAGTPIERALAQAASGVYDPAVDGDAILRPERVAAFRVFLYSSCIAVTPTVPASARSRPSSRRWCEDVP